MHIEALMVNAYGSLSADEVVEEVDDELQPRTR